MDYALLNDALGLAFTEEEWQMVFFLVSKAEHYNEDPDAIFTSKLGGSVWIYCEAIPYDRHQRGCHVGWCFITGGHEQESTAAEVFRLVKEKGGPDLIDQAANCYVSKQAAQEFCNLMATQQEYESIFREAQLEVLCQPGGYMYEAKKAITDLEIEVSPLMFVAVLDCMIDFGLGARKYCPRKFLYHRGTKKKHVKTLSTLLSWKRWISTKNNHNSCKHNGLCRANMYKTLMRKQAWHLKPSRVQQAVQYRVLGLPEGKGVLIGDVPATEEVGGEHEGSGFVSTKD
jgi:hypothetical protein